MMKKMIEEWKKELIEAGEIDSSEELTSSEIQLKYQDYQIKKMKGLMSGLGIEKPKKTKPKKKKKKQPPKPSSEAPKKKKIVGGLERTKFSQLVRELDELQKKADAEAKQHSELFNAICSSTSPELFEIINEQSISDSEKKMKQVRKIQKKLVNKSENGFLVPTDLEEEFSNYLDKKEASSKELEAIYSQIREKSDLLIASQPEMEEA